MPKNYRAELVGVFGDPVEGNPTGVMEEAAFAHCGLNFRYLTLKVTPADFPDAMKAIHALHMRGMNLTMPHKLAVLPYLDDISRAAKIIGAVNTIVVREDGTLFGENTDGKGFVQALANRGIGLTGKRLVLLGAGGAARAIAVECALAGAASLRIVNRTLPRAEELAALIREHTDADATADTLTAGYAIPADTDILINATCLGLYPNVAEKPDIDYGAIRPGITAVDVVFNPADTAFLKACAARGAVTVDGLGMLACQGALNFTLWTGVDAPLDVMERQLAEEFAEA